MIESSFVFLLREPNQELEIMYNQQEGQVVVAEAQIFVKGDHIEGGCLFFIDKLYDMDKLISYLSEIRGKMDKHYAACAGIMPAGEVLGVSDSIGASIFEMPCCTQCGKPQSKEEIGARISLCFDCEKKQIIKAGDNFKPVGCVVCSGEFDNKLQAQLGICGRCQRNAEVGPDTGGFVCDQCGENFDTKKQLQSHQVESCPNPSM